MSDNNLKSLTFGTPTSDMFGEMSFETPLIEISPDDVDIEDPPSNESRKTRAELRLIDRAVRDLGDDERRFVILADKNMLDLFRSEAIRNDVYFDEEYFDDLHDQLRGFILNLKFRYNRPRPDQIAKSLKIDLSPIDTDTTKSPSYPSGHTIHAMTIANVLGSTYPSLRQVFRNLGERIGLSRVQAGVHFPSDVEAGIAVSDAIDPYVLTPYDSPGDRREHDLRSITREFLTDL